MDSDVWNVLHDGELVAASGTVPGDLRLWVGIAYLCDHLPTPSDRVALTLVGCERFEYHPYQQPPIPDPSAVAVLGLELLTAGVDGDSVTVECADGGYGGQLVTRYALAQFETVEGRSLSLSELKSAADRYWSLWEQRHAK